MGERSQRGTLGGMGVGDGLEVFGGGDYGPCGNHVGGEGTRRNDREDLRELVLKLVGGKGKFGGLIRNEWDNHGAPRTSPLFWGEEVGGFNRRGLCCRYPLR